MKVSISAIAMIALLALTGCPSFTAEQDIAYESNEHATRAAQSDKHAARPARKATGSPPGASPLAALAGTASDQASVSARHILVRYAGSSRADTSVTRTKEQAHALAEQIVAIAKRPGVRFAELAKERSEGPSAPRGGDLGRFRRRQMHPAFEKAAFGLKVGAISDVVETPFGFHVIERYQ